MKIYHKCNFKIDFSATATIAGADDVIAWKLATLCLYQAGFDPSVCTSYFSCPFFEIAHQFDFHFITFISPNASSSK